MDGITNKDIFVESIEAKMASTGNMKYILIDNEKNKYFFWQKNKGQDSDVYLSFTGMGIKKGDTVHIGYTEKDEEFVNNKGETIRYKDRFILGLREASGTTPAQSSVQQKSSSGGANNAPQQQSTDAFGRRLGIQGHINALLSNTNFTPASRDFGPAEIADIIRKAIMVEDEAEKQINPSSFRQSVQAKAPNIVLPTIQQNEDIAPDIQEYANQMQNEVDIDSIPF